MSGNFPQRMSLITSPLIACDSVFVACMSDVSSVNYQVAGYRLGTGELLWNELLVRGEVDQNAYGRLASEFASPPLVFAGNRVIVETGLGLIAALEPATGEILWRTEYVPIGLGKVRSYAPPKRVNVWRTAPPVVTGDLVLAAPPDSSELLALDLADGHLLWSVAAKELSGLHPGTRAFAFDHLITAPTRRRSTRRSQALGPSRSPVPEVSRDAGAGVDGARWIAGPPDSHAFPATRSSCPARPSASRSTARPVSPASPTRSTRPAACW